MSRFSNALQAALSEIHETQTGLATRAGVDVALVNKYVRGKVDCGAANLQSLARALPERQRAEVVSAWLRDQIPVVAAGLVLVRSNAPQTTNDFAESGGFEPLAPALQLALEYLTAQAREYTEISDLLIDLARALRGDYRG